MAEGPLERLVDLVRRELRAKNARLEVGGDPPDDPAILWRGLSGGWRVVAIFDEPPVDRSKVLAKLDLLLESFAGVGLGQAAERPPVRVPLRRAVTAALADLAARAGGTDAVVIDVTSPVVWGISDSTHVPTEDVHAASDTASLAERAQAAHVDLSKLLTLDAKALGPRLGELEASEALIADLSREVRALRSRAPERDEAAWHRHILACRAIAMARGIIVDTEHADHIRESLHSQDFGALVRSFANIYLLVIAFDGRFSELHAEAAMLAALPHIERLVLSLPPVDPPTGDPSNVQRAQVVPLASRRRPQR